MRRRNKLLSTLIAKIKIIKYERRLRKSMSDALDYCIENDILRDFLTRRRHEVLDVLVEETKMQRFESALREDGFLKGRSESIEEGIPGGITKDREEV